jgi:O-antigen ligase
MYSVSERIFGHERRNFGFITVYSFFLIGFYSYIGSRSKLLSSLALFRSLAITNIFVAIIFLFQQKSWAFTQFINEYGVLPSTLGNPNFLSSFVAISIIGATGLLLNSSTNIFLKLVLICQLLFSVYIIKQTQSIQGFSALLIALVLYLVIVIRNFSPSIIYRSFLVALPLISSILIFFLRESFLSFFREQETLVNRTIYWKIGLGMVRESPIFGKGYDSYLDNFRRFLSPELRSKVGEGVISDSPHNLFFDFLVSGGLLLGGFLVVLIVLSLKRIVHFLLKVKERTFIPSEEDLLFILVLTYLAVASISPFNIGLFIWLPVIMGTLSGLGKPFNFEVHTSRVKKVSPLLMKITAKGLLALTLIICNPVSAFLPMVTETRYRSAVETGNFYSLKSVALDWPYSGGRAIAIAQGMLDSSFAPITKPNQEDQFQLNLFKNTALKIAQTSTKINVKQFESWKFLYTYSTNSFEKSRALDVLKQLDPYTSYGVEK